MAKKIELDEKEVVRLYVEEGKTFKQIAAIMNSTINIVRRTLISNCIKIRKRGGGKPQTIEININEAKKLYLEGKTTEEVAETLGVNVNTIRRRLLKSGFTFRKNCEAKTISLPIQEIVRLYVDELKSTQYIAKLFAVSDHAIATRLKKVGITIRKTGPVAKTINELEIVKSYVEDKMSVKEIANSFDVSHERVRILLHNKQVIRRKNEDKLLLLPSEEIVDKYINDGESINKLGEYYNASPVAIRKRLVDSNIEIDSKKKRSLGLDEKLVCDVYSESKDGSAPIGELFGASSGTILKVLKRNNTQIKDTGAQRQYQLNEKFFDKKTPESEYVLGFIYGDGNLSLGNTKNKKPSKTLRIALNLRDIDILEKIKVVMESEAIIEKWIKKDKRKMKEYLHCRICITSSYLGDKLIELGVVPNKTYNPQIIPNLYNTSNFFRGLVDADGWLYMNKRSKNGWSPVIGLCGSYLHMAQFTNFISERLGVKPPSIYKSSNSDYCYNVRVDGWKAKLLTTLLYGGTPGIYLNRKMTIAQQIMKWQPKIMRKGVAETINRFVKNNVVEYAA